MFFGNEYDRLRTSQFGLKWRPSFVDRDLNDLDQLNNSPPSGAEEHLSLRAQAVLLGAIKDINPNAILEIGVHRPRHAGDPSSTKAILNNKSPEAVYLGIDKLDKPIASWGIPDTHFLKTNSTNLDAIANSLELLGIQRLDLIFIDGCHSVTCVLNDWSWASWLNPGGIVVLHDTSYHPGPFLVFEAIDERLFEKTKYCWEQDWGISTCRLIKGDICG